MSRATVLVALALAVTCGPTVAAAGWVWWSGPVDPRLAIVGDGLVHACERLDGTPAWDPYSCVQKVCAIMDRAGFRDLCDPVPVGPL